MTQTPETIGIIAAIYAVARAIEGGIKMVVNMFRKRFAQEAKDRAEAKTEDRERDQYAKINDLGKDFAQHRLDDAQSFAALETKVDRALADIKEIGADVKTVLRRATGKQP